MRSFYINIMTKFAYFGFSELIKVTFIYIKNKSTVEQFKSMNIEKE